MAPPILPATDPAALEAAEAALRRGELVGLPTETVYGVCCALAEVALDRLVEAKGRDEGKGITLLIDHLAQARRLAIVSPRARRLAGAFWPGPLTLVLPLREGATLPRLVTGGRATVGFRLPAMAAPRRLARRLGPLPLTSANRSGEPDATAAAAVVRALDDRLSLVLDAGRSLGGVPSTVLSVPADPRAPLVVLRSGAVTEERIAAALVGPWVHFGSQADP